MITAEEFAKQYYQLPQSGIESVKMKSAIRFAERYAEEVVKNNLVKPDVSGELLSFFLWFRANGELHIDKSIEDMIEIYLKERL